MDNLIVSIVFSVVALTIAITSWTILIRKSMAKRKENKQTMMKKMANKWEEI